MSFRELEQIGVYHGTPESKLRKMQVLADKGHENTHKSNGLIFFLF